jgi:hypothetical protein
MMMRVEVFRYPMSSSIVVFHHIYSTTINSNNFPTSILSLLQSLDSLIIIHNITSQIRMVLSAEPDTIDLPLGEKDTETTVLE